MKKKLFIVAIAFLFIISLYFNFASAWGKEAHTRFCPENYSIDCNIADSFEFQRNNPYANTIYHVCYDNSEDCMSRLVSKYFLKKYYIEGKTDIRFLGAAAHLYQDSACPAHWYPGFKILGQDTYIFAPKWVKMIENEIDFKLLNEEENWGILINFKGDQINIDENYLNNLKKEVSEFISEEPEETLEILESNLISKIKWHYLRAYQNHILIVFVVFVFIFGFILWRNRKKKIISLDLMISGAALVILILLFILIKLFY